MTLASFAWRALVVLGLVLANAFFVAAEFALVASRRTRLEALASRGDRKARVAREALNSLDRYISGTQLGITLASLSLGWIGEPAIARAIEHLFESLPRPLDAVVVHAIATGIAFSIITFLHIVLGELAPKALALLHPEETSRWVAGPLIVFTEVTNPFIWLLNGTATWVLRLFGAQPPNEAARVHQPEEILMLARQSHTSGGLAKSDVRMIEGVFEFTEKRAKDIMTPRTQIIALPAQMTVGQAAEVMARESVSRCPLYRGSLDEIAGFVHIKQILAALIHDPAQSLAALAQDLLLVPVTREVEDVLADMKRRKQHMAVVLDEYGGTAGLLTMEDLLEEIVGPIYDESDVAEPPPKPSGEGITLQGSLNLVEANERYGLGITDDYYTTVGGYVFGRLGRLPEVGDRVMLDTAILEVAEMADRRVAAVKLIRV